MFLLVFTNNQIRNVIIKWITIKMVNNRSNRNFAVVVFPNFSISCFNFHFFFLSKYGDRHFAQRTGSFVSDLLNHS